MAEERSNKDAKTFLDNHLKESTARYYTIERDIKGSIDAFCEVVDDFDEKVSYAKRIATEISSLADTRQTIIPTYNAASLIAVKDHYNYIRKEKEQTIKAILSSLYTYLLDAENSYAFCSEVFYEILKAQKNNGEPDKSD